MSIPNLVFIGSLIYNVGTYLGLFCTISEDLFEIMYINTSLVMGKFLARDAS